MKPETQYDFAEPKTISEAEERRAVLMEQFSDIDIQLANPNRTDPATGLRLVADKYQTWRHNAQFAARIKRAEYNWLGRWIKWHKSEQRQIAAMRAATDSTSCDGLLRAAYGVLKTLAVTDDVGQATINFSDQQQAIIDLMADYLRGQEQGPIEDILNLLIDAMPSIIAEIPIERNDSIKRLAELLGWPH